MSSGRLTEEQRKRIEENRRKALEKRAALLRQRQEQKAPSTRSTSTSSATFSSSAGKFASSNAAQPPRNEHALLSSSKANTSMPQRQLSLQSGGIKPISNAQSFGQVSNTNMFTNSHVVPRSVGSIANSTGAVKSISKPSNAPASASSFQSTVSQFYRPQNVASSSIRKFESSNSATITDSVSANNRAGPMKSGAAGSLNFRKPEKEVKGNCVLISRERFTIVVPYQAQLIGIFKTMPSRSYDAKTCQWDFSLADYDTL